MDDRFASIRLTTVEGPPALGALRPSDFGTVVPQGGESQREAAVGTPVIPYLPDDDVRFFGYRRQSGGCIADAPFERAAGGTVYFDGDSPAELVQSVVALMQIRGDASYAAYLEHSPDLHSGYLTQLRIVSREALMAIFGVDREALGGYVAEQELWPADAILSFVEHYRGLWRARRYPSPESHPEAPTRNAYGEYIGYETFDGLPGRNAAEMLGFGLMVENSVHPIYRVWTRTWFAHK